MGTNIPKGSFTIRDHSKETSGFDFGIIRITAALLPAFLTDWGLLRDAVEGITLGVVASERAQVFSTRLDGTAPTDSLAQREVKWEVRGTDVTEFLDLANTVPNPFLGKNIYMEIPTADLTLLDGDTEFADPTNAAVAEFVTRVETLWRSDSDGQIEVQDIKFIGVNI